MTCQYKMYDHISAYFWAREITNTSPHVRCRVVDRSGTAWLLMSWNPNDMESDDD